MSHHLETPPTREHRVQPLSFAWKIAATTPTTLLPTILPTKCFHRLFHDNTHSGREYMMLDTISIHRHRHLFPSSTARHFSTKRRVWFIDNLNHHEQRTMADLVAWFETAEPPGEEVVEWDGETLMDYDTDHDTNDDDEDNYNYSVANLNDLFEHMDRACGGVFSDLYHAVRADDWLGRFANLNLGEERSRPGGVGEEE